MDYLLNLTILRDAIINEPVQNIDLCDFRSACGTIHCAAGLATTIPFFRNLGLCADNYGSPVMANADIRSGMFVCDRALNTLFKPFPGAHIIDSEVSYDYLFQPHSDGVWDADLIKEMGTTIPSDKDLVLARLNKAIAIWEQAEEEV